jgi:lipoate-protein ligase B
MWSGVFHMNKTMSLLKTQVLDLGTIDYAQAYPLQKSHVQQVLSQGIQTLLLCEHPPVITLGRLADEKNLLVSSHLIKERGVSLYPIDRGGDITLHAPGQLVVYPIFDLRHYGKDLHLFLHKLEQVIIDLLADFGIVAGRQSGRTGVWYQDQKIASLGIGVRQWVSYHGFAVNINTDLNLFSLIKPCGLDVSMTSMAKIKGRIYPMEEIKEKVIQQMTQHFNLQTQGS